MNKNENIISNEKLGEKIGEKIKQYRKELGITQKELGIRINKSESTIRKYESGSVTPSMSVIHLLADELNINSDKLLTAHESAKLTIDYFNSLSDTDIIKIPLSNKQLIDYSRKIFASLYPGTITLTDEIIYNIVKSNEFYVLLGLIIDKYSE